MIELTIRMFNYAFCVQSYFNPQNWTLMLWKNIEPLNIGFCLGPIEFFVCEEKSG